MYIEPYIAEIFSFFSFLQVVSVWPDGIWFFIGVRISFFLNGRFFGREK